ncbi:MAG: GNAT family N-acetyltransferase [Candidatus Bathyarchaeia archaeon]|jgi:GNAT superfamily N-acetyltransferase
MITRTSKASSDVLGQTAEFIVENEAYMKEAFPQCSNKEELVAELRKTHEQWNILRTDRPIALFTLQPSQVDAVVDKFYPATSISIESLVPELRLDLKKAKIQSLTLRVPEEMVETLEENGFEKRRFIVKFVGTVIETKLMPILPLVSPTERDISALAKLMHESYEKGVEEKLPAVFTAERRLHEIMDGVHGADAAEASLISGTTLNVVSACFVTLTSLRQALVAELFTHPLYRARGLATTEVATSMNRLFKRGVQTLAVRFSENNEIAGRLFAKLGFKQESKLAEMFTVIQ